MNAAVACDAHQRVKLERLCCYVSRGPIALERLSIDGNGLVVHELKPPFRDGTTHVLFAPNAQHRQHIVTGPASLPAPDNEDDGEGQAREPKPTAPKILRVRSLWVGVHEPPWDIVAGRVLVHSRRANIFNIQIVAPLKFFSIVGTSGEESGVKRIQPTTREQST